MELEATEVQPIGPKITIELRINNAPVQKHIYQLKDVDCEHSVEDPTMCKFLADALRCSAVQMEHPEIKPESYKQVAPEDLVGGD